MLAGALALAVPVAFLLVLHLSGPMIFAASCPGGMVLIPAGEFIMGSDAAERHLAYARSSREVRKTAWFDAELPRQIASLRAFCIDRTLVTQAAYAKFVRAGRARAPTISKAEYQRQGFLVHDYDREVLPYIWTTGGPPASLARHPVVLVSATAAEAYCAWRHTGGRLPTEGEWEKAARGVDGRIFPWGDRWDPGRLNSEASKIMRTTPVGRFPDGASPFGLLDAVGNVFQWTSTFLDEGRRVLKGCGWDDELTLCRPAFRHGRPPESRHILIGFRCASVFTP
jgi:formylglycine-generating enzyme required for sulfatase activity